MKTGTGYGWSRLVSGGTRVTLNKETIIHFSMELEMRIISWGRS
jgi:hypothetical protein